MSLPTTSPSAFLNRYQLTLEPNNVFGLFLKKIIKLLNYSPLILKTKTGEMKGKKVFDNVMKTFTFFLQARKNLIAVALDFDKTKMGIGLNNQFNYLLRRNAGVIRNFETNFFDNKAEIFEPSSLAVAEIEEASLKGDVKIAGVGVLPAIAVGVKYLIGAAVPLTVYLFKKPAYQELNLKQTVMDYDLETMSLALAQKKNGVDEREITAFMEQRKQGIDRKSITQMDADTQTNNYFGKGVVDTFKAVGQKTNTLIWGAGILAIVGIVFMMKKKK